MNAKDYLRSKAIFDNPRIVDSTGQSLDYYLEELLIEYAMKVKSTLAPVSLDEQSEATVCEHPKEEMCVDWDGDNYCKKCRTYPEQTGN